MMGGLRVKLGGFYVRFVLILAGLGLVMCEVACLPRSIMKMRELPIMNRYLGLRPVVVMQLRGRLENGAARA